MISYLKDCFKIDTRALSFFRIGLSVLLLVNFLCIYFPLSESLLSDMGAVPRAFLLNHTNALNHSIFFLGGSPLFVQITLLICAGFSLALLLGWKTRICLFFIWVALLSVANRNLTMASGVDDLLRLLCFWALFLPLNKHASLDAALSGEKPKGMGLVGWGAFAFTMQILLMYVFTGILKWHPIWHEEGSALFRGLSVRTFSTDFGVWAIQNLSMDVLAWGAKWALWLEIIGPILYLASGRLPKLRTFIILSFIGLHSGLILMMNLGLFPWVCILMWMALLPSSFWEYLESKFLSGTQKATLFYDEDCGFCKRSCLILVRLMLLNNVDLKTAQSSPEAVEFMKKYNSWTLSLDGKWYYQSFVFYMLLGISPVFFFLKPVLRFAFIPSIVQKVYVWVSHNRVAAAKFVPSKASKLASTFSPKIYFVLPLFMLCFAWNLSSLPESPVKMKGVFKSVGHVLRLEQGWSLFAPYPSTDGGEFRIIAMLPGGIELDAFTEGAVDLNPKNISDTFHGPKWRKYLTNLWFKKYSHHRRGLADYFCRKLSHLKLEGIQMNYYLYQINTDRMTLNSKGQEKRIGYFECD